MGAASLRVRWAALGAAIAVALGGGIAFVAQATVSPSATSFHPITPCRLLDTRPGTSNVGSRNTPIGAGESYLVSVRGSQGQCNVPSAATAIATNTTVLSGTAASFLTLYPANANRPLASNLNWVAGQPPTPNQVTVTLSPTGQMRIYNDRGTVHAIVDVVGYFASAQHHHDERYYTRAQVDAALGAKANTNQVYSRAEVERRARGLTGAEIGMERWDLLSLPSATVPVAAGPSALAFDGTHIWVVSGDAGSVSKIDPATNAVVTTVPLGLAPGAIAFDGTHVWVAIEGDHEVAKIAVATNSIVARVPVCAAPAGLAFDGTHVWVGCAGDHGVRAIHATTHALLPLINLTDSPRHVAFDGVSLWVTNAGSNVVHRIDPATNSFMLHYNFGHLSAHDVAFDGGHMWFSHPATGKVSTFNPRTNTFGPAFDVPSSPLGLLFDGRHVWVMSSGSGRAYKLDQATGTPVAIVPVGSEPVAATFDGVHVWVANAGDNTVSKIRAG